MPLNTILFGTDLSHESDLGLRTAHELARGARARLEVVYSVVPPTLSYLAPPLNAHHQAQIREEAQGEMAAQFERVGLVEGMDIEGVRVAIGQPSTVINEQAALCAADLIVLGPHRPRALFDDLLGSTGDRVTRTSALPCLIANRHLHIPPRRVLVGTDFSKTAHHAFEVALDWLSQLWSMAKPQTPLINVELMHVHGFARPNASSWLRDASDHERYLQEQAARPMPPGVRVQPRILSAPVPVDGLLHVADEDEIDLLVLGTHGHGPLVRALIGSVASNVLRRAPHPLLLVPLKSHS